VAGNVHVQIAQKRYGAYVARFRIEDHHDKRICPTDTPGSGTSINADEEVVLGVIERRGRKSSRDRGVDPPR
jgi:hypothetical protein